eukprot:202376-Hanusia_phi.AAC.2
MSRQFKFADRLTCSQRHQLDIRSDVPCKNQQPKPPCRRHLNSVARRFSLFPLARQVTSTSLIQHLLLQSEQQSNHFAPHLEDVEIPVGGRKHESSLQGVTSWKPPHLLNLIEAVHQSDVGAMVEKGLCKNITRRS